MLALIAGLETLTLTLTFANLWEVRRRIETGKEEERRGREGLEVGDVYEMKQVEMEAMAIRVWFLGFRH